MEWAWSLLVQGGFVDLAQVGGTPGWGGWQTGEVGVFRVELLEFHEGEGRSLWFQLSWSGLQEAEEVEFWVPPCKPFEPSLAGLEIPVLGPQFGVGLYLLASQSHIPLSLLLDPPDKPFLQFCICDFAASTSPPLATLLPPAEVIGRNSVLLGHIGNWSPTHLFHQKLFGLFAEDLVAPVMIDPSLH